MSHHTRRLFIALASCVALACIIAQGMPTPSAAQAMRTEDCLQGPKNNLLNSDPQFVTNFLKLEGEVRRFDSRQPDHEVIATEERLLAMLQAMQRQLDDGKLRLGECYGKGAHGEREAKAYETFTSQLMKWRQEISKRRQELLASNEADRDLPRWQTRHGDQLKRSLTDTEIVIEKIHTEQKDGVESTIVELRVTNKHVGVILRPRNAAVYGYDADSPNVGGTMPIGARLSDSFGNFFKLENVSPKFYGGGSDRAGIRPGEAVNFTLKFADAPVRNSTYVLLSLQSKTVGQEGPVEFRLPADVFFGSPYLANRPH